VNPDPWPKTVRVELPEEARGKRPSPLFREAGWEDTRLDGRSFTLACGPYDVWLIWLH